MVVFLVGKDTLKISEAYINAFPAFSCPLFASKNPIVHCSENWENCILTFFFNGPASRATKVILEGDNWWLVI